MSMINLNNVTDLNDTAGRVSELDLDRRQNERAAFGGAASVKPTEPDTRVTYEEIMAQPWRYPQGRNVPLPASHPARISPPEDDDQWRDVRLPWYETLLIVVIWGASFAALIYILAWIFRNVP